MWNLSKKQILILITGLLLLIFGCSKEPTETGRTPTSAFPLTTDSRWEYSGMWYTVPFNEPSLADTAIKEIYRHIIGPDSLPGIANLVICDDTVITYVFGQVDTFINRQWLKMEDDKLKQFAHDDFPIGSEPNPVINDFPHNLLDFPLSGGKAWIVWTFDFGLENKSVVGIDYLELPFGWQYIDVVRSTIWDSATNDTMRSAFEWYSDDGLMRAEYAYATSVLYDDGGVVLDSVRSYEIWELIELDIQP